MRRLPFGFLGDDELIVRASAVLKSQGPENWSRGRPGNFGFLGFWVLAGACQRNGVGGFIVQLD